MPRAEPVSGIAGGRVPRVDRIECTVIPDPATAAAALQAGEQDYWQQPLLDLLPMLRRNRELVAQPRDRSGTYAMLRFNQAQPPFANPALRRAVAMAVNQADYMRAVAGDEPDAWGACRSFFACGTPLGTEAAGGILRTQDPDRAREAVRAAGYAGERVVLIAATDSPAINAMSEVTADLLRRLGFNLDYVATDWGTMLQRRASREPVERGGWSIFHTLWNGVDVLNPAVNQMLRGNGRDGWFGWPEDPELERLRLAWLEATNATEQRRIAEAMQVRAFESMPYLPLGYYLQPHA